jgi:hypothetical protein
VFVSLNLIVLGSVGFALGVLVVNVLTRLAAERNHHGGRRERKTLNPHSVNTLTRLGSR